MQVAKWNQKQVAKSNRMQEVIVDFDIMAIQTLVVVKSLCLTIMHMDHFINNLAMVDSSRFLTFVIDTSHSIFMSKDWGYSQNNPNMVMVSL